MPMTIKLLTIIRDLEAIMVQEGYERPTSIGLTITGAKILRHELQGMIARSDKNQDGSHCFFHGIEIKAPDGFDWKEENIP